MKPPEKADNTRILQETPVPGPTSAEVWGSDAIAETLRRLDIPYLALNPGSSYRGLHDSLVNYLGNTRPQLLLCLHEENAVAIAHGYAKASERMMGAVVHYNVGLMHATMAVYNAWCDRVPMLLLGATGPVDAVKRRPWIDCIHTSRDQGALIRDYTKWDDQPSSIPAAQEALLRAVQIARTAPCGPTFVNLDVGLQEAKIGPAPAQPDAGRYQAPQALLPAPELVKQAAQLLSHAKNPVIMMGRVSRSEAGWRARMALAEKLNAKVLTDLKTAASFPTDHPLHLSAPGIFLLPKTLAELKDADVLLSLDWMDLGGTLRQAWGSDPVSAKVIQVSLDQLSHRGWGMEYFGLSPMDHYLMCEPDIAVPLLLEAVKTRPGAPAYKPATYTPVAVSGNGPITIRQMADALNNALGAQAACLARLTLGWNGEYRHFRHPLDFLGTDGGGGVGSGPGIAVGMALALKDSGRLPVTVIGDGDFMMTSSAIWTAAHFKIPLLMVVANNRSFFNDEMHQERMAKERGRPVENKWIGQTISEPDIDLAAIARAQGAEGIGPVIAPTAIQPAIERGIEIVKAGGVCVVDIRVMPSYDSNMNVSQSAHKR